MKTVIMAGGAGTRISGLFPDIPKPLIPIAGVPVLERELLELKEQGFDDVILTVSHMADAITAHFGDGSRLGIRLSYFVEKTPLGNAGALFELKDSLTDDFLLLNADTVYNVDFNRFVAFHRAKGGLATLFTHPNSHPYDSGLIVADNNHAVERWYTGEEERPRYYKNRVNAGLHVLSKALIGKRPDTPRVDLDRQLLKPLAGTGKMFCYDSPEYVKDMGTPERFEAVCRDYASGQIEEKNLRHKQKAIFIDRDGTINRYGGFVRSTDAFVLEENAAEAIRMVNASGYLAVVITNQPVIARGEVTEEGLTEIHNKMETLLGEAGAYLDAIYYCPHHPDKGFAGEIPSLKIVCECRKPKPGMLHMAENDLNIDLSASWMIGDEMNDILAGKAAGTRTGWIRREKKEPEHTPDLTGDDLLDVVTKILEGDKN
ncbi:MAG: HAD-IIIA family hydrolase [Lachnospiraceae bacterium]|nr:HAD-IIIA family hydrolase [Lachnospiraceae bacterium]